MRKKQLLQIAIKGPSEDMVSKARTDRNIKRPVVRQWWTYSGYEDVTELVSTYATRLYFTAQKEDGILVVCVYTRGQVAAGTAPLITTYIDTANEKWISRIGEKWSEAYLSTMIWNIRCDANLKNTDWGVAKDVFAAEDLDLCNKELCTVDGTITESVKAWQEYVREKENRVKLQKRIDKWEGHMALIPPLPEGFEEWADKDGAGQSNFLFYRKKGKKTEVYCTHCGKTWKTDQKMVHTKGNPGDCGFHPEKFFCMRCGEHLPAKAWGRQKYLRTDDDIVLAQKAGEYIVFRKFHVAKRFRREGEGLLERWNCGTSICETLRVLANPYSFQSMASYVKRTVEPIGRCMWAETFEGGNWNGYYSRSTQPYLIGRGILYMKNIGEVLENTGVKKIVAELFLSHREENMQYALQRAAKKGYIEYLIKAGLKRLAREAAYNTTKFDEGAKDLKTLLGVNGQQLYTLKKLDGDGYMIDAIKYIEKHNEKIDDETLQFITSNKVVVKELQLRQTGMTLQRMINYLRKQSARGKRSFAGTNNLYKDYLKMAADRGMDLTDEIICHTPRLREMHDRYLEEKNAREDAAERLRVNKKFPEIKKSFEANTEHFGYQKAGLKIFVPRDAADIRREGKLQHHCVGATDRYMERMAKRETFILFLRRADAQETPYYTLEVEYDGKIRQSYGAYDRKPDWPVVEPVLKSFTRQIRKRTEKEKRERILAEAI